MSSIQTMGGWSKRIVSFDQLPAVFLDAFKSLFGGGEFPYTVYSPGFKIGLSTTNEMVTTLDEDKLIIFEKQQDEIKQSSIAIADINNMEYGMTLLRSWITITSNNNGKVVSSKVEYNTVSQELYDPIIKIIRTSSNTIGEGSAEANTEQFDYLLTKDFAFMNYAKLSILQGENIIKHVYEPNVNEVTNMVVLTDKELIILRDDIVDKKKFGKYGIIRHYIPNRNIKSIAVQNNSIEKNNENSLLLSVHLKSKDALGYFFTTSSTEALNSLVDEFEKIA